MEEVNFNTHGTELVILNGPVYFPNNTGLSGSSDAVNPDIIQQAFEGANTSLLEAPDNCKDTVINLNNPGIGNNGYLIVSDNQKSNGAKMLQLALGSPIGLQFNSEPDDKDVAPTTVSDLSTTLFTANPIKETPTPSVSKEAETTQSSLGITTLSDLLTPVEDENEPITLVPQYVNGQLTYSIQLVPKNQLNTSTLACTSKSAEVSSPLITSYAVSSLAQKLPVYTTNPVSITTSTSKDPITFSLPVKQSVAPTTTRLVCAAKPAQKVSLLTTADNSKVLPAKGTLTVRGKALGAALHSQKKLTSFKTTLPIVNSKLKETLTSNQKPLFYRNVQYPRTITGQAAVLKPQLANVAQNKDSKSSSVVSNTKIVSTVSEESKKQGSGKPTTINTSTQVALNIEPSSNTNGHPKENAPRLTSSQLKQIVAVLNKNRIEKNGSTTPSTLYDTETNTRIICRVVYPEDFGTTEKPAQPAPEKKKVRKPTKKELDAAADARVIEEKVRPVNARTRSGRLSRPPKHIFRDSIVKVEEDFSGDVSGPDENIENAPAPDYLPGIEPVKQHISSRFRCPTCNKLYLGQSKMAQHLSMFPDHGDEKFLQSLQNNDKDKNGVKSGHLKKGALAGKNFGHNKRPIPLKEIIKYVDDKEVASAAAAKVVKALSLWELLLLRVEEVHAGKEKVPSFLQELGELLDSVKLMAKRVFEPLRSFTSSTSTIHLEDDVLCNVLGVNKGYYTFDSSLLNRDGNNLKRPLQQEPPPAPPPTPPPAPLIVENQVKEEEANEAKRCRLEPTDFTTTNHDSSLLLNTDFLCDKSFDQDGKTLSVDQILNESLSTLTPVDDIISSLPELPVSSRDLDPSDDLMANLLTTVDSMSTPSLSDSMIFNPNNESNLTHQNHVSASTEDLMKSLEKLTSEMPPVGHHSEGLTADLDFTVLSNDSCG